MKRYLELCFYKTCKKTKWIFSAIICFYINNNTDCYSLLQSTSIVCVLGRLMSQRARSMAYTCVWHLPGRRLHHHRACQNIYSLHDSCRFPCSGYERWLLLSRGACQEHERACCGEGSLDVCVWNLVTQTRQLTGCGFQASEWLGEMLAASVQCQGASKQVVGSRLHNDWERCWQQVCNVKVPANRLWVPGFRMTGRDVGSKCAMSRCQQTGCGFQASEWLGEMLAASVQCQGSFLS